MDIKRPCLSWSKQPPRRSVACNVVGNTKYYVLVRWGGGGSNSENEENPGLHLGVVLHVEWGRADDARNMGPAFLLANLRVALARSLERAP